MWCKPRAARQDDLTELVTAPYLTETCTREINRGSRFHRPTTLLLLDVDGLGELNAAHGHQTGDLVLRATARTITAALREYDLAARLTGGLFAVLLPETDLAQAQVVAERVRRTTAEQRHDVPGSVEQARVTLSIGAAIVTGQRVTATETFEAARKGLAKAKRDGGNQIAFESVQDPSPASRQPALPQREVLSRGEGEGAGEVWLRAHAHTLAICALAAAGISICLAGAIAELDWPLLAVMLSLSALAGLTFYFRSLPLALALACELNRSPARRFAARQWRMWPQYVAIAAGCLLTMCAYAAFGLTGALGVAGLWLLVRRLAGRYVDRTLDSVRKLRNANESLEHQAFHDPLTNLPNRALFAERLDHAMVRAGDGCVAVLFIDLDNFKTVNDTLGHAAGDALLVAATERVVQCVRREDTIARLGGDEFTVLLEDMHDPSDAARMAERIRDSLNEPFDLDGKVATISSSIGIALDTDRSHAPDDLMREADLAMYRAKSGGKARYEIFDTDMAERAMQRLGLETELRHAVERGEMLALYQPVVSVGSDEVVGLQAVSRWRHPRFGVLVAAELQRLTEDTGVVVDLGRWLLEQACLDARQWQARHPGVALHLRLSSRQLEQLDLVHMVRAALANSGLRPELLHLNVTNLDVSAVKVLRRLRSLGVALSLDEVGVGPLPLDALSAASFDALALHPDALGSREIVRATTAVGEALGMAVLAHGKEAVAAGAIEALFESESVAAAA
jgi:diguanylate cyclase (GGDEF)-like protein